jgi:YedE family putative selenium metabolism protein
MALLRGESSPRAARWGWALALVVGGVAAVLVLLGNPGNMGLCGACFLRDVAGSVGLLKPGAPRIFRPEILGVMVGALGFVLVTGRYQARSGTYAVTRLFFGALMGMGALVFLGCPFRLLQRLGGGDATALFGALGLVLGVGLALPFERRGTSLGRSQPVPAAVGVLGTFTLVVLLALFLLGGVLEGPGPGDAEKPPPHAPWTFALGLAIVGGALLSATGFCAISAAREVWGGRKAMLVGALCLVAGYGVVLALGGKWKGGFEGQPLAHTDHLWSVLSMALVGLCGALAGGCPVRQVVMAGEGNGDAFVTAIGILLGGAIATNLGAVSSPAGATSQGHALVVGGLVVALLYAALAAPRRGAPSGG